MTINDGTEISGFLGNKIIEGTVYTQETGTKVVLNEQTGKWTKLRDLSHIKILNESEQDLKAGDEAKEIIGTVIGNPDVENKLKTEGDLKKFGDNVATIVQSDSEVTNNLKKAGIEGHDKISQFAQQEANAKAMEAEAMKSGGGDIQKAQAAIQAVQRESVVNEFLITRLIEDQHSIHIEDEILHGSSGIKRLLSHLNNTINLLEGSSNGNPDPTVKFDGAPAITMGTTFPGLQIAADGFVSTKSIFNKNAKIYQHHSDIDNDDRSDELKRKLHVALDLALQGIIPENQIWQGDLLWTQGDAKTYSEDGENYVYVKPNTLCYAAPVGSDIAEDMQNKRIGIVFHTRYFPGENGLSDARQSNDADVSFLNNIPDWAFVIDAKIKNLSGKVSFTAEQSVDIKNAIEELERKCNKLISNDDYNILCSNKEFIQFYIMTLQNNLVDQQKEIDPDTFVSDLHDWVKSKMRKNYSELEKLKTKSGRDKKRDKISDKSRELHEIVSNNEEIIYEVAECLNTVTGLKSKLLDKLNQAQQFITAVEKRDSTFNKTGGEGFVVSDIDGNFVKLVDRKTFSFYNRSNEIVKGFEHPESLHESTLREDEQQHVVSVEYEGNVSSEDKNVIDEINNDLIEAIHESISTTYRELNLLNESKTMNVITSSKTAKGIHAAVIKASKQNNYAITGYKVGNSTDNGYEITWTDSDNPKTLKNYIPVNPNEIELDTIEQKGGSSAAQVNKLKAVTNKETSKRVKKTKSFESPFSEKIDLKSIQSQITTIQETMFMLLLSRPNISITNADDLVDYYNKNIRLNLNSLEVIKPLLNKGKTVNDFINYIVQEYYNNNTKGLVSYINTAAELFKQHAMSDVVDYTFSHPDLERLPPEHKFLWDVRSSFGVADAWNPMDALACRGLTRKDLIEPATKADAISLFNRLFEKRKVIPISFKLKNGDYTCIDSFGHGYEPDQFELNYISVGKQQSGYSFDNESNLNDVLMGISIFVDDKNEVQKPLYCITYRTTGTSSLSMRGDLFIESKSLSKGTKSQLGKTKSNIDAMLGEFNKFELNLSYTDIFKKILLESPRMKKFFDGVNLFPSGKERKALEGKQIMMLQSECNILSKTIVDRLNDLVNKRAVQVKESIFENVYRLRESEDETEINLGFKNIKDIKSFDSKMNELLASNVDQEIKETCKVLSNQLHAGKITASAVVSACTKINNILFSKTIEYFAIQIDEYNKKLGGKVKVENNVTFPQLICLAHFEFVVRKFMNNYAINNTQNKMSQVITKIISLGSKIPINGENQGPAKYVRYIKYC